MVATKAVFRPLAARQMFMTPATRTPIAYRRICSTVRPSVCRMTLTSPIRPTTLALANAKTSAYFHNTPSRQLLPPLPQKIIGTVNDAATVPDSVPSHGSYHWTFERLISAVLIPLTVVPFAAGSVSPVVDALLVAGIIVHTHIGFESVIIDYIPTKRLPMTRKVFMWGLKAGTLVVAVGFYEFETNDVGLCEAIKRIWKA